MSNERRPNSADSLQVHRPRFSFCEPENVSTPPPPVPTPKPPEPPPTINELLARAKAQRRRAIREENYEFLNRLDADIERLQRAVRQGKGTEQSSKILAKSDLKSLLGNLEKQMLQKTKKRIFGSPPLDFDPPNLIKMKMKREMEGGGIGENIREYWTNSTKSLMPRDNTIGRSSRNIILDLERKANELDRMLKRELALGINGRSFYVPISSSPEADSIGWIGMRRRPNSFSSSSKFILRRPPFSPDFQLNSDSFPIMEPKWEKSHLELLEQIRCFDAEMGIASSGQKPIFGSKTLAKRKMRMDEGRRPSSASIPRSPPILTKYTANWVRKYGWANGRRMDGPVGNNSPYSSRSPSPPIFIHQNQIPLTPPPMMVPSFNAFPPSRRRSFSSNSSGWSSESPFAPPKGFHRQRRAKKLNSRCQSSPNVPFSSDAPSPSPLPTPPELKEDYAQTSPSPKSPLLDRQQFLLEINPADRGFASRAVDLFGLETMANIYARDWAERKQGIEQMLGHLRANQGEQMERQILETAIPLLKRTLQDPLFQVFSVGIELFFYLADCLSSSPTNGHLQRRFAAATASSLANRIGDRPNDKRFANLSLSAFDRIFDQNADQNMANFFLLQLLRIQNTHHQMKHHSGGGEIQTNMPELTYLELGYVEAVSKAVKALWGVGRSCNEYRICPFIRKCLASPAQEIRTIGRELAEWIYEHGNGTNRQLIRFFLPLPAEDDVTAKAKADFRQLGTLYKLWDTIDGCPHDND